MHRSRLSTARKPSPPKAGSRRRRARISLIALATALLGCSAQYRPLLGPAGKDESVCLLHGRVLAGPELTPREDTDLCFTDGRIVSVAPHGQSPLPSGFRQIDVRGTTVLPGLVDTHVHVEATDSPPWRFRRPDESHNLEAWLYAGITTVFDMGGPPDKLHTLQAEIESHARVGPHIFHTHEPFTAPGGHPIPAVKALLPWPLGWMLARQVRTVASPVDAEALVQSAQARGAGYIKVIHDSLPPGSPQLDRPRLRAIVEAAHARGLKVFVHVGANSDALDAVAAGADHLAHGVYRDDVTDELVSGLRQRRISVTFTAAGFENTRKMALGQFQPDVWAQETSDPQLVAAVSGMAGSQFGRTPVVGDFALGIVEPARLRRNIRKLHDGGVVILVGTDSPVAAVFPGVSYHEELALLREAGIPTATLLRRATVEGARLLTATPGFGELTVGMRADVLVVAGDPLTELSVLRRIQHVFVAGRESTRVQSPSATQHPPR